MFLANDYQRFAKACIALNKQLFSAIMLVLLFLLILIGIPSVHL